MKRILSMLLVAMLLVGCLSTVAFAESTREFNVSVTLSGAFASLGGKFVVDGANVTNVAGGGLTYSNSNGKVGYYATDDNATNLENVSVTVTVEVPADSCGDSFTVSFFQEAGMKTVHNDDGEVVGYEKATVTGSSTFTVDHAPMDEWKSDETHHWHECKFCSEKCSKAEHSMVPMEENGMQWTECECGYATEKTPVAADPKPTEPTPTEPTPTEPTPTEPKPTEPSNSGKDEVADTGDATPYGLFNSMIAVVVLAMVSTVVFVFKRKTAK